MNVFAVGKVKIQDNQGSGRLLLYGLYLKKTDAEAHVKEHQQKYYKQKPYLCPMVVKEITIK